MSGTGNQMCIASVRAEVGRFKSVAYTNPDNTFNPPHPTNNHATLSSLHTTLMEAKDVRQGSKRKMKRDARELVLNLLYMLFES